MLCECDLMRVKEPRRGTWCLGEGTDQQDGFFILFAPGRSAGTGDGRFPLGGRGWFGRRHQQQSHRLVVVVEVVDGRGLRGAALHRQQPLPPQHAPRARFLHIHISYSNTLDICMHFSCLIACTLFFIWRNQCFNFSLGCGLDFCFEGGGVR
jgi:hypothetical protein